MATGRAAAVAAAATNRRLVRGGLSWFAAVSEQRRAAGAETTPDLQLPSEEDILAVQRLLQGGGKVQPRQVPLLLIDSMLPGQRLRFSSSDPRLVRLASRGEIGVLGTSPLGRPLIHGVTAMLARPAVAAPLEQASGSSAVADRGGDGGGGASGAEWELRARWHMQVVSDGEPGEDGLPTGRIELVEDEVSPTDIAEARSLPALVARWRTLVEGNHHERFEGQVKAVLADLGPMPPPEAAGHLALWVAALINPLPALGVAYEIRPAVLAAPTVTERLRVVREGIEGSIGHVSGKAPLF